MTTTPLSDLVARLADELKVLSKVTEDMHQIVCDDCAREHLHNQDFVRAVQSIDHTTQILDNLSEFLGLVAKDTPEDWSLDVGHALDTVRLAALKSRLAPNHALVVWEKDESGDVDLF
ncbi:hypothetical protein [Consotaella salsifontis]|uniref:Uncharacterized protein n=1 Tax=Consotaella salsifontis TaxID=1365950 RepID=A0A1T4TA64_9HYPH|nr:hypothetical protein [Consotaella salsifontis]SKA37068.1 hypothetical protein SAMN05428963_12156 [Consotaella salsifontis]